jgi:hypothetical protein
LNKRIIHFFAKNPIDKKNKPPELNAVDYSGHGLSPSMKAVQLWTLLKFLPVIVGDLVAKKVWVC